MKLLDLIGLNPIKPLIAYGGDGGGGGGGDDDDRYIDPYEEMDRNPQNYADPNYGGGGDGPEYGPPVYSAPVIVPEVYVPPTVRPQLRPADLPKPTTNYQGNSTGGGGDDDGNNLVGTPVGFSTGGTTAPATATGEKIGALPRNSFRETLANMFTPKDGASYINGQLVDDETGASLRGGGMSTKGRQIYGVADDISNNTPVDTTGMSPSEAANATAAQQMTDDIPPSTLSYFASFLPGMISPVPALGSFLGKKMLEGGIQSRKSIVDQQIAALEMGATPQFDAKGNYIGYDNSTITSFADQVLNADDVSAFMPPSTKAQSFKVTQKDIDEQKRLVSEYGAGNKYRGRAVFGIGSGANLGTEIRYADGPNKGYTMPDYSVGQNLNLSEFDNPSYSPDANNDGINDYDRFRTVYDSQSDAAGIDPTGMSTEGGFITSGGDEYYVQGDGSASMVTDNIVPYNNAAGGSTVDQVYGTPTGGGGGGGGNQGGGDNRSYLGGPNAGPARSIYNRYYKGGGGRFLPPWLQRYASGVNIDELLTKQVIDGVEYYITPEGRQIEAQYLTGAAVGAEQDI